MNNLDPIISSVSDLTLKLNLEAYKRMSAVKDSVELDKEVKKADEENKGVLPIEQTHIDILA